MPRIAFLTLGIFMLSHLATAQDTSTDDMNQDVFAPFVSRLRVAVRDPQVRLTWRDSADLDDGTYRVYRHTREITTESVEDAQLVAEVSQGVETYLDTPQEEGFYYYAVLAAESDGRAYPIFVPFRNKTLRPVEVTRLATEEELAADITDIRAQPQESTIVVVFTPSRNERTLAVYRSTQPFGTLESVSDATLLEEIQSTNRRFADYPVPGVEYYYGVFDKALIERGTVEVKSGANVLADPVQITLDSRPATRISVPAATKRRAPLPILRITSGIQSGNPLSVSDIPRSAPTRPVSSTTQAAIDELLERTPEPLPFEPEPRILPRERTEEGVGVSRTLHRVINREFADGDYAQSVESLEAILEIPMSTEMGQRVRFYLGQALYFEGRWKPAFMQFLVSSENEELYTETRSWIDGILNN